MPDRLVSGMMGVFLKGASQVADMFVDMTGGDCNRSESFLC